ncbi:MULTISPECIES: HAD family hydrolase [Acinetobacter]|uniref:HAD family hydrolase n=1 Tax=Acinetobacter TaxID=469 RepID=UPI0009D6BC23|nr:MULTISPECIES: HAD hydrolase-like protein [Acinetobacter]MCU4324560.1 HAD hydrolase-like protein [Acinetobacter schindleri]POU20744.1 HAD family hydrolase [Acinetobacter sp. ACNIH3]POV76845.1 HAD family hydrolase [Acinetobacter sp. ACNIH4]RAZ05355.1 HAD family hydrolase [Acinetobacter sp. SM1B]
MRKIVQQSKLHPEQVIYIGDQIIDIESAHRNRIAVAAVTWGFNSESVLVAHQPHYLIHSVQQLKILLLTSQSRLA